MFNEKMQDINLKMQKNINSKHFLLNFLQVSIAYYVVFSPLFYIFIS